MLRQEIKLRADLLEKVKCTKKTSTIRKGAKPYRVDLTTMLIDPNNYNNRADIFINSIRIMNWEEISVSDSIVESEGYETIEELRAAIVSIYGVITGNTIFTVVDFNIVL